jgi:signal transduction histidine kinase
MTLRTAFCIGTGAAVLVLFGVWESISLDHMSNFLMNHEAVLREQNSAAVVAAFREGREQLMAELRFMRWAYALGVVPLLMFLFYRSWRSLVMARLKLLLTHINIMKRGTWTNAIPIRHKDEIGELTAAFNELGPQLSLSVQQYAGASKLSVLALLGSRFVRRTKLAADHVTSIRAMLEAARKNNQPIPEAVFTNLNLVAKDLHQLETDFDTQFSAEFKRWSFAPPTDKEAA